MLLLSLPVRKSYTAAYDFLWNNCMLRLVSLEEELICYWAYICKLLLLSCLSYYWLFTKVSSPQTIIPNLDLWGRCVFFLLESEWYIFTCINATASKVPPISRSQKTDYVGDLSMLPRSRALIHILFFQPYIPMITTHSTFWLRIPLVSIQYSHNFFNTKNVCVQKDGGGGLVLQTTTKGRPALNDTVSHVSTYLSIYITSHFCNITIWNKIEQNIKLIETPW